MSGNVQTTGLTELVRALKGPAFRDINKELRAGSKLIAQDIAPHVSAGVRASGAHQASNMAATVRVHPDRVPVVAVGKVNPRFSTPFRGGNTRRRRGAMSLGVVAGPAGGHRSTSAHENYYGIRRDSSWGSLGRALQGRIMTEAETAYLKLFIAALRAHGLDARTR
jgi:hypothetical protein